MINELIILLYMKQFLMYFPKYISLLCKLYSLFLSNIQALFCSYLILKALRTQEQTEL